MDMIIFFSYLGDTVIGLTILPIPMPVSQGTLLVGHAHQCFSFL